MSEPPPSAQFTEGQIRSLMWMRGLVAACVDTLNGTGIPAALYKVTMEGDVVTLEVQATLRSDFEGVED